ncbi:hairy-related 1 [Megalops cyprinoides]|uniref:hairy-related 1 n=1 Tax=Megalops cyprinoides TaxID=118141 RepID=UPI0018652206|nr:hairy-related 1 [Megalops cyprinoides]
MTARALKPMVEKKRRDRINQSLDELRTLLLSNTLDTRLQNPKLEKAEILELTVEYIRKRTKRGDAVTHAQPSLSGPLAQSSQQKPPVEPSSEQALPVPNPLYMAGFQQCVSRLASFMDCVNPSKRDSFLQGLKHYLEPQSPHTLEDTQQLFPTAEVAFYRDSVQSGGQSSALGHPGHSRPDSISYTHTPLSLYQKSVVLHHPPTSQSLTHPYLSPPYSLSPPPSPSYTSSSLPLSTPPPYLSVPCHFPFPPNISPLSCDSSSSVPCTSPQPTPAPPSQCPSVPFLGAPPLPSTSPPTPHRPSAPAVFSPAKRGQRGALRRSLFHSPTQPIWRPWS